ncbi:hypothetical protein B4088_2862 [Bacillus cereus]|uniref:Uncharacterized protein n=1 Tax=Bacillus cereus TaxID=1396 RepID=A0A164NVI7_BACCE|nr:hypothetical protein B4088_2862 [Bacillus cereus]
MKEKFNADLLSGYDKFLKTVNGLDFNGLVLHGGSFFISGVF